MSEDHINRVEFALVEESGSRASYKIVVLDLKIDNRWPLQLNLGSKSFQVGA